MEGSSKAIELIDKVSGIPLLDKAVVGIMLMLEDGKSNFGQISRELTPSVVAKFLMMANSAYYE